MKRRKRFSLTLLEVVIAMGITGLLLSTLWGLYRSWYSSYHLMQKSQVKLYRILFTKHTIENLCSLASRPGQKNFIFSKDAFSVCFSYKPKIDVDPAFRDTLCSLLYLDAKAKTLCLATWGAEEVLRKEVLLDQVSSCKFSFFDKQTSQWILEWLEERDHLPLWMKIELETKGEKETLLFRLSYPEEPILYFDVLQEREEK